MNRVRPKGSKQHFYRNQIVEVRSAVEIAATLDVDGSLDGLPFMPEMLAFCGRRIAVHRRADRTCVGDLGFRRMHGAVFLHETRCDGSRHDGCDRGCLLFWKEAWLKPAAGEMADSTASDPVSPDPSPPGARTCITRVGERYVCQSTRLAAATAGTFSRWDVRPLLRDIRNRELTVGGFFALLGRTILNRLGRSHALPLTGAAGAKSRGNLHLRSGEWVDIKPAERIVEHLDPKGANCGMVFRPTMQEALGGHFQVAFPVRRIIDEDSGKMIPLQNTVALKGVTCQGPCVANCPRNEYLYWRESWLERSAAAPVPLRSDA